MQEKELLCSLVLHSLVYLCMTALKHGKILKKTEHQFLPKTLQLLPKMQSLKADTRARLNKCAESLEVRYTNGQIPQDDYNDLCDLIKTRKEVITT